ncbi:MAG: hypothetical protein Kow0075_04440 [Salibacteraceae bacterium]
MVKLDDKRHMLHGFEEVTYHNHSPDTLTILVFHLWPNAYKNTETALAKQLLKTGNTKMAFADPEELGFIDSLKFVTEGRELNWYIDLRHIDICTLLLSNPLYPGDSVVLEIPFRVKIPSGKISRLGHLDQSYQITQWFPKPAVYDTSGWHGMPYLHQGEFYSEFGNYTVQITLPENYVVGATGSLTTTSELNYLHKKDAETREFLKQNVGVDSLRSLQKFPPSADQPKTIQFVAKNVHDFAWFADKRYLVLHDEYMAETSDKSISLYAMFTPLSARLWQNSIEYLRDAVYYYSLWNGPYPWPQVTADDGTISAGGGMEYPMVTVIGGSASPLRLEQVIMHEVGHNWFYGILASNERRWPWMDEGINSYNELRYMTTKYPTKAMFGLDPRISHFLGLDYYNLGDEHYFTYLLTARPNADQPISSPAASFSTINYGSIVYSKTAVFMNYLRSYLGDSIMDSAMHRYYQNNAFKHPDPTAFERAITASTNRDLDWFFGPVLNSTAKLDYKIKSVKLRDDSVQIRIVNKGHINGPLHIGVFNNEALQHTVWIDGFQKDTVIYMPASEARSVVIDPNRVMPELYRDNNYARVRGLFKRVEPFRFKFMTGVERPDINHEYYLPVVGYNTSDGIMAGLFLYNHIIPDRAWSHMLAPMYGFSSHSLAGSGLVEYSYSPLGSLLETIDLRLSAKRYAYGISGGGEDLHYNRIAPTLEFNFRPPAYSGYWRYRLQVSSINVLLKEEELGSVSNAFRQFNRVSAEVKRNHPIFPTAYQWNLEQARDFIRTHIEIIKGYRIEQLSLQLRLFGGTFISSKYTHPRYNWRMDGQSAFSDYAFDAELLDRKMDSPVLSKQFAPTQGGFKTPTAWGQSRSWITSANLKLKIEKMPVGLFGDIGSSGTIDMLFDAGLFLPVIPDAFEVYLPLMYSGYIQREINALGRKWYDLIRFQLNLDMYNPLDLMDRIKEI